MLPASVATVLFRYFVTVMGCVILFAMPQQAEQSATRIHDETAVRIASQLARAVVEIKTTQASGSGFLVNSLGVIVTNHHVAEAGDLISVTVANGDRYNIINKVADDAA